MMPVNRKEIEDTDNGSVTSNVWTKYFLREEFRGHAIGCLSLLEKIKVPPFLSYLFDRVFIGDFTRFYTFVKINRLWYEVPNLIIPFVFVRKVARDKMQCLGSSGKVHDYVLCLDRFCCH